VADSRVEASPRIADAAGATSTGDITSGPVGAEDLLRDQPQIDQASKGPGTSGMQVPQPLSSSLRLPLRSINWNHTPWQENWFEDNEEMQALRTNIVTINTALTVSCL
jgi:hypothetical protein